MNGKMGSFYNTYCKEFSTPEVCPNTWVFYDDFGDYEDFKIDTEFKVECGKI